MGSAKTRTRVFRDASAQQAATAYIQKQNTTCEGCTHLIGLRPKCDCPTAAAYRTARETYHPRCTWYAVRGQQVRK